MSNIFTLENVENFSDTLNIDELYEFKKSKDQNELNIYNKVLNRIHVRIRHSSKNTQLCWYLIPEIILGVPNYNHANCTSFVMSRLENNGFQVRYIHPNLLMVSWAHFVPSYVRNELKRKTGVVIDEYGHQKIEKTEKNDFHLKEELETLTNRHKPHAKKHNDVSNYKPSGKLF